MEKFRTSATIVTFYLLKQAIWVDMCNLTFGKITHMQLICSSSWVEDMWKLIFGEIEDMRIKWLCICSRRQYEKTFENHFMAKFRISATLVILHLFKKAIWKDTWKLTFEKITHMQLMCLCIWSSGQFEKTFENHLIEKFRTSAAIVPLHLFKQAIWEDVCK